MKIISWNINGLKSVVKGGFLDEIFDQNPDILCLQEIKSKEIPEIEGYTAIPNPNREKSGFYGTAIYTKIEPITVRKGFGSSEFDKEGRVIRAEFENFNLFTVYAPSGNNEERLNRKFRFYEKFTNYINKSTKPAIVCGDFNRISEEIDAKDIKKIKNKSGFLPEEEAWFREILESNYIDAFRKFHSEGENFTWWPNRKKPVDFRAENKGYRFDYFLVSKSFEKNLTDSYILKDQLGSDHAPIVLELNSCPVCGTVNNQNNEYCYICGIKLIESNEEETIRDDKLTIPKDKIILLDLNYTLTANSKEIKWLPLDEKIRKQQFETELIKLIKDNYVILITASPYKRSHRILRDLKEKTGFEPDESFWNFNRQPHIVKKYWMENEILPAHGDNPEQYLAIESNATTRSMYKKLGIEARPKGDFI